MEVAVDGRYEHDIEQVKGLVYLIGYVWFGSGIRVVVVGRREGCITIAADFGREVRDGSC